MSSQSQKKSNSIMMKEYLNMFIDSNLEEEYEVRFGTKGIKPIQKIDFDNVIKYLKSKNFEVQGEQQNLKIRNEYIDKNTGKMRISNMRTEINGTLNIQKHCKTNKITNSDGFVLDNIYFTQKMYKKLQSDKVTDKTDKTGTDTSPEIETGIKSEISTSILKPIDFDDFNFRVSYQDEKKYPYTSGLVKQVINKWEDTKKLYRLITRYSFTNKLMPYIRVDMSVVRSSKNNERGRMVPTYNMLDSEVLTNKETYEIEIEVVKPPLGVSYPKEDRIKLFNNLNTTIKYILSGLQQTNYPISYTEMKQVSSGYLSLIYEEGNKEIERNRLYSKHFIGPSSISLEVRNIQPLNEDNKIPNIRQPYTVTDKADGIRKMMYINEMGKIYLIDTNMNIQFSGLVTNSPDHRNSLIDGEHILHNKVGEFINLYAAFDIYYINKEDQRMKPFVPITNEDIEPSQYRLMQLNTFINTLKAQPVSNGGTPMRIQRKVFEVSFGGEGIFKACKKVLDKIDSELYEYETDGIIFTPCEYGVGMSDDDKEPFNYKHTWMHSFKWKPPEFNTVDFLVTTKKDERGRDMISNIFEEGKNLSLVNQLTQYKTLILRVGFDERKHGYINPCKDVIDDKLPSYGRQDDTEHYKPIPFYPTNPTDNKAYLCNVVLNDVNGEKHMFIEDGKEVFEDNTIVEFKYNKDGKDGWRWVPIRVRYDKTAEYRNGLKNYGNAYHVAQSVWSSIHNPVTKEMLRTGLNIPDELADDDVYYNRAGKSYTRALRDFHNLYVKRKLIMGVSRRGNTLIDLAVGKGGDFSKWIAARLKFVFGVDVSKDNIENRLDGACARYLNYRKKFDVMPGALFIQGNSSLNLRDGTGIFSEKGKQIMNAVVGRGPKDPEVLGKGVYKYYGIGENGFNIVSTQFALHYFFQTPETLHNYLQNVSENCEVGGYFIGTSYDGKKLFKELEGKKIGESISEYKKGQKIWEITKSYENETIENNSSCIGMAIDVYQETINKVFREYLVNYEYLDELLRYYGFELVNKEDAKKMRLSNSTGMFSDLYKVMKNDIYKQKKSRTSRGKTELELEVGTSLELEDDYQQKRISFLNRYFVYQKKVNVNAEEIKKKLLGTTQVMEDTQEDVITKNFVKTLKNEEESDEETKEIIKEQESKLKMKKNIIISKKPKKLTKKIRLKSS
jgi:hypothetical protein